MTTVAGAPSWTTEQIAAAVAEHWGLADTVTPLPSERDQNALLRTADGGFVVKIANIAEDAAMIDAEVRAMAHVASTGLCPQPVKSMDGREVVTVDGHMMRVITLLPGVPLGSLRHRAPSLLRAVGAAVGSVSAALADFAHPAIERQFRWDLAGCEACVADRLHLVRDDALRAQVDTLLQRYRSVVPALVRQLRRGAVHHDANDFNVLVDPLAQQVTGIVDFGDMVQSHLVNEVAVAAAYALLGADDPLAAVSEVVHGFHGSFPLTEVEAEALWPLIGMRLAMSVCIAHEQQAARPDNEYLGISQGPIAAALPGVLSVHPRFAHYAMRAACGFPPVPAGPRVEAWLASTDAAHVVGLDLTRVPVAPLDMSAGSTLVGVAADNRPDQMWAKVQQTMAEHGAAVGAGGYGEARLIYSGDHYGTGAITTERRTVHLGVDVTMVTGSPLYAPFDAVVHGFEFAADAFDYGPVIVLRHTVPAAGDQPAVDFFTLWGHLTLDSLDGLHVGKAIAKGEEFARIGEPPTNGNWWPHVHLQLILDMFEVPCNFDGSCLPARWNTWKSVCPDPNLILRTRVPEPVPTVEELGERRRARTGGNLSVAYGAAPLQIVRGRMQYLFDERGRTYVDAFNNVAHVGHSHPAVVEAVTRQLTVLNTNTRYLQRQFLDYADALCATLPHPLEVCYFTASGSEANELALRLARAATGARDVVVMQSAYHGHTTTLVDVSPYKHDGPGGTGAPEWVHTSPIPDVYRGRWKGADAGARYASEVGEVLARVAASGRRVGAYLAETCPSVGGQIIMPPGFLSGVYERVRAAGGVCIADEVQTGFGRLGTSFWGFEPQGVVPDIVVLGKPIANGYPMGAVVTTRAIADAFDNGMEFFSTFGGSTAACAAAAATLRVVQAEGLQAHAAVVGGRLLRGLRELAATHSLIGDVRGSGLFLGVELVLDRDTLEPAPQHAAAVVQRMREMGVLAGTDGPHHNVVKLRGPMVLSEADADLVVDAFDRACDGLVVGW